MCEFERFPGDCFATPRRSPRLSVDCGTSGANSGERLMEAGEQLQLELPKDVLTSQNSHKDLHFGVKRRSPVAVSVDMFHRLFRLPSRRRPGLQGVSDDLLELRVSLIDEEAREFADAVRKRDLCSMADALADIVYVAYGAAVTLGIDLDDVLAEVHSSNLSKLGRDGRPIYRSDGKVLKPDTYRPPDIERVLDEQPPLPRPHRASITSI